MVAVVMVAMVAVDGRGPFESCRVFVVTCGQERCSNPVALLSWAGEILESWPTIKKVVT